MQEGNLHKWFKGSKSKDGKGGWVNVVTGGTCASDEPGEGTPKCVSSAKRASMSKKERLSAQRRKKAADPGQQQKSGAAKPTYVSTDKPKKKMKEETFNEEDKKGKGSGKKDACYHKVKASAKVWPSAYASGRLVQCRKKGAANYGKSKNEEFLALPEFSDMQIRAMEAAGYEVEVLDEKCWVGYTQKGMKKKGNRMVPNCVPTGGTKKEGYAPGDVDQKVGAVTSIPKDEQEAAKKRLLAKAAAKRAAMKKESVEIERADGTKFADIVDLITNEDLGITMRPVSEAVRMPSQNGNLYMVGFQWRGKAMFLKIFFPEVKRPTKFEVEMTLNKIYPGARVRYYDLTPTNMGDSYMNAGSFEAGDGAVREETEVEEAAAWTKKSGKSESGGLNEKGRKSYERENPGSDLKAPSKKVGNPRRKSFCARMKGMKKKLTSSKTANDPDSRINKSLRAWNC